CWPDLPDSPQTAGDEPEADDLVRDVADEAGAGRRGWYHSLGKARPWPALQEIERRFGWGWRKRVIEPDPAWIGGTGPTLDQARPAGAKPPHEGELCTLRFAVEASGSLDELSLAVEGGGQRVDLDLDARLQPRTKFI